MTNSGRTRPATSAAGLPDLITSCVSPWRSRRSKNSHAAEVADAMGPAQQHHALADVARPERSTRMRPIGQRSVISCQGRPEPSPRLPRAELRADRRSAMSRRVTSPRASSSPPTMTATRACARSARFICARSCALRIPSRPPGRRAATRAAAASPPSGHRRQSPRRTRDGPRVNPACRAARARTSRSMPGRKADPRPVGTAEVLDQSIVASAAEQRVLGAQGLLVRRRVRR